MGSEFEGFNEADLVGSEFRGIEEADLQGLLLDDVPLYWLHLEVCLRLLAASFRENAIRPAKLLRPLPCHNCGQRVVQGLELDYLAQKAVFCRACLVRLEGVIRLSGYLDENPRPAMFDYEQELSTYFRSYGTLWFAAYARRYGVSPGESILTDLAAAALIKRFFHENLPAADQAVLFHWSRAAVLSTQRCVMSQLDPEAIEVIHATTVRGPIVRPPRALMRPFFVEIGVTPDARLVDNTIYLGWYPLRGRIYLFGLDPPLTTRAFSWEPRWGEPLEAIQDHIEESLGNASGADWAARAARFILLAALYQQAQPPPLVFSVEPIKVSRLKGGRPGDDGFAMGRAVAFTPYWLRSAPSDEIPAGELRSIAYSDIGITTWTPSEYHFQNLADDCAELEAAVAKCRRPSAKEDHTQIALYALALMARVEEMLPRFKAEDEEAFEIHHTGAWTVERCVAALAKALPSRQRLLNLVRPFSREKPVAHKSPASPSGGDADSGKPGEIERLRRAVEEESRRASQLEVLLRTREAELVRLQERAEAPDAQPNREPERKDLRAKVDRLKVLIDQGNAERRELRQQLAEATRQQQENGVETTSDAKVFAEQEEEFELVSTVPWRGVRPPVYTRSAQAAFDTVPASVASQALRVAADLGGGAPAAWQAAKQAKHMPRRPLFMTRIGIHYRLLFHCDRDGFEVVDLIPRESLDVALKHLRAAG